MKIKKEGARGKGDEKGKSFCRKGCITGTSKRLPKSGGGKRRGILTSTRIKEHTIELINWMKQTYQGGCSSFYVNGSILLWEPPFESDNKMVQDGFPVIYLYRLDLVST